MNVNSGCKGTCYAFWTSIILVGLFLYKIIVSREDKWDNNITHNWDNYISWRWRVTLDFHLSTPPYNAPISLLSPLSHLLQLLLPSLLVFPPHRCSIYFSLVPKPSFSSATNLLTFPGALLYTSFFKIFSLSFFDCIPLSSPNTFSFSQVRSTEKKYNG